MITLYTIKDFMDVVERLVQQGLTFDAYKLEDDDKWTIQLTGGY